MLVGGRSLTPPGLWRVNIWRQPSSSARSSVLPSESETRSAKFALIPENSRQGLFVFLPSSEIFEDENEDEDDEEFSAPGVTEAPVCCLMANGIAREPDRCRTGPVDATGGSGFARIRRGLPGA